LFSFIGGLSAVFLYELVYKKSIDVIEIEELSALELNNDDDDLIAPHQNDTLLKGDSPTHSED
jgi:hypothetical protein